MKREPATRAVTTIYEVISLYEADDIVECSEGFYRSKERAERRAAVLNEMYDENHRSFYADIVRAVVLPRQLEE